MAQADQTVQNATFPTVRADINNNLAALFTDSSGGTAPSVTVAFQDWIDTSGASPLWKKRNAANNAWITLGTISASTIAFEGTLPSQTGNAGEYLTTNGVTKVLVSVIGGGGGGRGYNTTTGSGGGDGGRGGHGFGVLTVTPGTVYTVTIGSGGDGTASSSSPANGTAGGTSTFSTISATGGSGGTFYDGADGSCSSADATLRKTVGGSTVFIVGGSASRAKNSGTSGIAYAITSELGAGASGSGGVGGGNGAGGVGGAVALLY